MNSVKWKLLNKLNTRFAPATTWLLFVENHVKWRGEKMNPASHWKLTGRIFSTVTHYWFSVECNEKWIFWLSALARPKHHADVVKHNVMVLLFRVLEVNLSGVVTAKRTLHKFINRAKSNLHFPATLFPGNKLCLCCTKKGLLREWKPKEKWWVKLTNGRAAVKTKTEVMQICASAWVQTLKSWIPTAQRLTSYTLGCPVTYFAPGVVTFVWSSQRSIAETAE